MERRDVFYTTVEDLQLALTSTTADSAVHAQAQLSHDGDVVFVDADDLQRAPGATSLACAPPEPRASFIERPGGYPRRGPGRKKGSGLDLRESLLQVLLVLLSTSAYMNLMELFAPDELAHVNLTGLRNLRYKLFKITDKALRTRAWDLSRSGAVGVLIKYGTGGSRDDRGRHLAVAVEVSLTKDGVVCVCSEAEKCLGDGSCSMQEPMQKALDEVRLAAGVTMADLFVILGASRRMRSRVVGRAVLYGPSTCVVKMQGGSWPFAVVRKTRTANWICFSCRTADGSCQHAAAASEAARGGAADESEPEDGSDDDNAGVDGSAGDGRGPTENEHGHGQRAWNGSSGLDVEGRRPDRRKQTPQSLLPRHIVPPLAAQEERATILLALQDPSITLFFPAADKCPYCQVERLTNRTQREVLVECGEGVASGVVYTWRCHICNYRVIPDGRDLGIVFTSSSTAYSEVFLFEMSVNLSRNGSSLRSSAYLRDAYWEMSSAHVYPDAQDKLGSVTTLRKAIILYLSLVIAGIPAEVTRCSKCVRLDGSYAIVCFDGLQLGYRLKFMVPFLRSSTKISPIARASVYARVIRDEALSKALGGVLSATTSEKKVTITTLTAMRGNIMAFILLNGYVEVDGFVKTFAGSTLPKKGRKQDRGWDPIEDGGVRTELIEFLRFFFVCRRAARALAMIILGGPLDLLRRVPRPLIAAVQAAAADFSDDAAQVSGGVTAFNTHEMGNEVIDEGAQHDRSSADGGAEVDDDGAASEGGSVVTDASLASDGELSDSGAVNIPEGAADEDFRASAAYVPPTGAWDDDAPLRFYAEQFGEPALADTGGASGAVQIRKLVLPLRAGAPCTAASALKVLDFVRAVVVDPFTVWAPTDDWSAVDAVFNCLLSNDFSMAHLSDVVARTDVSDLRLLRGAVACLAPTLCAHAEVRRVFAELLLCLVETRGDYDDFVAGAPPADADSMLPCGSDSEGDASSDDEGISKTAMTLAHPDQVFTPQQYTRTWLLPEATAAAYAAAHGLPVGHVENFLRTGVWAPGLPPIRSLPGFVGGSSAQTDFPDCQHDMGKQKSHTGGTFGGFCTFTHPKCLGVVVLDQSESQRMPIEFVVQRFATLPDTIIYDFACAALKTALVRLPHVAKKVSLRVDRFHWRKNHTLCSKAMSPDSYASMDGANTSSSEERNALSRRQQHHLRQMKQDHFILFTVYQQALSNVVAMYRDHATRETTIKWPEWYRRTHVDNEDE